MGCPKERRITMDVDAYIGEIRTTGFDFAPVGWLLCFGQYLPVSEYPELYSVIGTLYGGDGRNNFRLPDLRGHCALGAGTGRGLSARRQGSSGGTETATINATTMAAHTHAATAQVSNVQTATRSLEARMRCTQSGTDLSADPAGRVYGKPSGTNRIYGPPDGQYYMREDGVVIDQIDLAVIGNVTVENANTGQSQAHDNMMPSLTLNYIIAYQGEYPVRQ
jgi:microcystin-dependent protein